MADDASDPTRPAIHSVNVGAARTTEWLGRSVRSAIWKVPVEGPVSVAGVNLDGDHQADRRVHGGADKAVYAYAQEDYEWWSNTHGELQPGTFGDNLTTVGIDMNAVCIGDRWMVGTAVFEAAQPRTPCFKLAMRMGDPRFTETFEQAGRLGLYLRIVTDGVVRARDAVVVEPAQLPSTLVMALGNGDLDDEQLRRAVDDERIPDAWRRAARRALRPPPVISE